MIFLFIKRNNTPLTNSVVGDELVGKVGVALQPLIAHSGRITLENEGSTVRGVVVGTNHEHGSLSMELLTINLFIKLTHTLARPR